MAYKGWTNYSTWRLASLLNTTEAERKNVMEMATLTDDQESFASELQEMYTHSFTSFFESKQVDNFKGLTMEHLQKVDWSELSEAILAELAALGPDEYGGPEMDDPEDEKKQAAHEETLNEEEDEESEEEGDEEEAEEEEADEDVEDHQHSADQIVDLEAAVEKIIADYEEMEDDEEGEEEAEGDMDLVGLDDMEPDYAAPEIDMLDI